MNPRKHSLLLAVILTILIGAPHGWAQSLNNISPQALQQIQALEKEKESRTPAQKKIGSQLIYAMKLHRGEAFAGMETLNVNVGADAAGRVVVDIRGQISDVILKAIVTNGGEIITSRPSFHIVRARVPLDNLDKLAALPQVRAIRLPSQAMTNRMFKPNGPELLGPVTDRFPSREQRIAEIKSALATYGLSSLPHPNIMPNGYSQQGSRGAEGDMAHRAFSARGTFNVDGTGIRIGVLSDGANNAAASQASGDLPPTCSLPVGAPATEHCLSIVDNTGNPGDEGTAMMEVIHDLAPGAQLYFATAFTDPQSFAQNIRNLRTIYHCDIIVDDVSYSDESPFQDGEPLAEQATAGITNTTGGLVTQAVNDVVADGAIYFSSAANSGNVFDGTAGTYEGDFIDNGGAATLALLPGGTVHDFGTASGGASQFFDVLIGTNGSNTFPYDLFWADPLGGSSNDYDLFVLNSTGTTVISSSTDIQNGTQDPHEAVSIPAATANAHMVVFKKTGAANRFFHLDTNRGAMSIVTNGNTHGHNAASKAYGTAATPAYTAFFLPGNIFNGPFPNPFTTANFEELFSSDGPRRMFFQGDGTPYTPGNFSSTGGMVFQQPLITAADGQDVTGVGGFPSPFFGTSCAAPTGAAIASLLRSGNNGLTAAQMQTALTTTAVDVFPAGVDDNTGHGIIMAYEAAQAAGLPGKAFIEFNGVTLTEACGNGDGFVEPGETGGLAINLKNTGLLSAAGVFTTLTTSTPNVTISQGGSSFANLAASGGSGANVTQYRFKLDPAVPVDQVVTFTLTINYANGWQPSQTITFDVQTGRQPISTVLDATAPPVTASFPVSAVGTMTGRLNNLSGIEQPSSCAVPRANPGNAGSAARRWESYSIPNLGPSTCVTITLTPSKDETDFLINGAAYLNSFNPANPSQNYLGDFGFDQVFRSVGGYPLVMSVTVPAGQTLVMVVQGINPAPQGDGTPYTLQVSGLPLTAAPVAPCGAAVLPTVLINDTSVTEGNAGTTNATFTVSLSAPSTDTVTVDYATADGSAHAPGDYTATSGTVTFLPGETSKPVTVPVVGDTLYENNESFVVNLSNVAGATFGDPQGRCFILNDDAAPSLSIDDVTVAEGNSGSTTATFTVTLSAPSGRTTTVDYATANGTATTPDDYTAASGTLAFAPGETTKTIAVSVNGDTTFEPDETFFVNLMNATNATISDAQGQGTITNDDASPTPTATATATATPTATPASQALNLSTRMRTDTGDNAGIGGFTITGSASKHVLIRALGPSLTQFGFTAAEVLADPTLEVHGPGAFGTLTNNNWRDSQEVQIKSDGLPPTNDLEAAIDATLPPGQYTAIVRGNTGTPQAGLCLFEVYDLETAVPSKLANLSTRAFVGTGNNVVIAGFVLGNNQGNDRIVVRGLGPSLSSFGIANTLADPTLELRDENGSLLFANNDWQDNAAQAAEITADGLAPSNAKEAAIAATLPPGLYTAILAGLNNTQGVGIVEIYDLGP